MFRHSYIFHHAVGLLALLLASPGYADSISISGKLVDTDGKSALPFYSVYLPDMSGLSSNNKALFNHNLFNHDLTASKSQAIKNATDTNCKRPNVPHVAFTCSNAKGEFTLHLSQTSRVQPRQLKISGPKATFAVSINISAPRTDLGNVQNLPAVANTTPKIAIVSVVPNAAHQVNTANDTATTYLLDSEILTGYGITMDADNIEYHEGLLLDSTGKSILDVERYSMVLVKGSWQDIVTRYSQKVIQRMLKYVEAGGRLLIRDNKINSASTDSEQYI